MTAVQSRHLYRLAIIVIRLYIMRIYTYRGLYISLCICSSLLFALHKWFWHVAHHSLAGVVGYCLISDRRPPYRIDLTEDESIRFPISPSERLVFLTGSWKIGPEVMERSPVSQAPGNLHSWCRVPIYDARDYIIIIVHTRIR